MVFSGADVLLVVGSTIEIYGIAIDNLLNGGHGLPLQFGSNNFRFRSLTAIPSCFAENLALKDDNNKFDEVEILDHYLCGNPPNSAATNGTEEQFPKNEPRNGSGINSIVKLVQGSTKNLAIQIGGESPFMMRNDAQFDSTRPLLYFDDNEFNIYLYLYCPNVTEGNRYKKWSLVNIWVKAKKAYSLPINIIWQGCPHTMFNQTLIFGSYNVLP